ncbi:MAG: DUF2891 domain-containing protein [Cyclobacteriaceae bacterium]|nr:DUF2891 domain-containing protein [Cyclobacteriaceae bacterium]
MRNSAFWFSCLLLLNACNGPLKKPSFSADTPPLDIKKAEYLYHFAFECIGQEYPYNPGHVLGDSTYLATPARLHPAFYGCFDWHSSVHGHWTLVTLLQRFPDFAHFDEIMTLVQKNLSSDNLATETQYFDDVHNKNFERTYGWAWVFKLQAALNQWDHPAAKQMSDNLLPLTLLLEQKLIGFLQKLNHPIRVGEHPNTAFALSFALDYAREAGRTELEQAILAKAREYYANDLGCPLTWEPGGFDFLSPCLQEASLMAKVLPGDEFEKWLARFMPGFMENPSDYLLPALVTDRSDGKLAHLDGLNFSRAWCLYEIGAILENTDMIQLANTHFATSYDQIDSGEYAGTHWLASFALYSLIKAEKI